MEFRKVLALRGPNIWTNAPVIEAWVDLKELDRPSTDFPGFSDRLMSWLPSMIEHRCSVGERGGFFQRLRQGTYPGHILEHVTLELQSLAGREVGFGRARETSEPGVYRVVVKYHEEQLALQCLQAARRVGAGGDPRSAFRREGRGREAAGFRPRGLVRAQHKRDCRGRAGPRHSRAAIERQQPGAVRLRRRVSGGFKRRRPTAPAPSPKRSPRTRN